MRRFSLVVFLLCSTGLLAACQGGLAGKTEPRVTANAITGDPIEVAPLDGGPTEDAASTATGTMIAAGGAAAATAAQQPAPIDPVADVAIEATDPAPQPELAEVPATPKSDQQLACERKKGTWSKIGKGDARSCIFQTRDAGKQCKRESQCDGVCLARSGTCAPFKPLFGCNEILQDNGARVTLCLD